MTETITIIEQDAPTCRLHIWRYDNETPTRERPWIISFHGPDDSIIADALDFETLTDAIDFASGPECWEYLASP